MPVEVFELILMLLLAVLLSSILDQVVPRISSPLIQIALGIGIAMLPFPPIEVNIDPELFLVLFIAPLLFSDALEADKRNLWGETRPLSFHLLLVWLLLSPCVLDSFFIGLFLPFPCSCICARAALGPTDAVAVQALKKEAKLGKREGAILQGEALINDASGVVSFQFAVAAAVTGAFSLPMQQLHLPLDLLGALRLAFCLLSRFSISTNVFAKWAWITSHSMCSSRSRCPLLYSCSPSSLVFRAFWLLLPAALCVDVPRSQNLSPISPA